MHIMNRVFRGFEEEGIRYLHFKSNKNLAASFAGRADFDVLVDEERICDVRRIIADAGGKRFRRVKYGIYPGVEDWILFDPESGCLHHLHLHSRLMSGKAYLKEYEIPWAEFLFGTRVKDPVFQIYISDPNAELMLLSVRSVIKSGAGSLLRARFSSYRPNRSMDEERKDLLTRTDRAGVEAYAKEWLKFAGPERFADLTMKATWSGKDFTELSEIVRRELAPCRRYGAFASELKGRRLWAGAMYNKFLKRKLGRCRIERKVPPSGGKIIAFVGVDGAGKSTVTDLISKWMAIQIESRRFYMGAGDGSANLVAKVLKSVGKAAAKSGTAQEDEAGRSLQTGRSLKKLIRKTAAAVMVYSVEKGNEKKLRMMDRYRALGGTSLLDRYPQTELPGKNDGPKIALYREQFPQAAVIGHLARREADRMAIVKRVIPDMVFRLRISAETSMARKPEQKRGIDVYREKIEELDRITFQGAEIVDIDAEQPFDEEILQIKKTIWERL